MQSSQSTAKNILHYLLYYLLVDLRTASNQDAVDQEEIFWITNLFHNIPLKLGSDEPDYQDILGDLINSSKANLKLSDWFAKAFQDASQNSGGH